MSQSLYWEPATPQTKHAVGDIQLRDLMVEFGTGPQLIGKGELAYLAGLRDAKVDGAQELIDAINQHGAILLTRE
jgi:hypothetical protein